MWIYIYISPHTHTHTHTHDLLFPEALWKSKRLLLLGDTKHTKVSRLGLYPLGSRKTIQVEAAEHTWSS